MCSVQYKCNSIDYDFEESPTSSREYYFNGSYENFYDVYVDMVKDGIITEYPQSTLDRIEVLE